LLGVGLEDWRVLNAQRRFQLIFSISLGIVVRFVRAALDGAVGMLQGAGCWVWLQIYTCMHVHRLASNPWRKSLATISTKGCIDTGRLYQPGFAVYIR
jgi:hypothetical protein